MKNSSSYTTSAEYSGILPKAVKASELIDYHNKIIQILPLPALIFNLEDKEITCANELLKQLTGVKNKEAFPALLINSVYTQLQTLTTDAGKDCIEVESVIEYNEKKRFNATLNIRLIAYTGHTPSFALVLFSNVHNNPTSVREDEVTRLQADLNRVTKEFEEFSYIASHDLQEPLRKITTFSGRLSAVLGKELSDDAALYLSRMNIAADNMRGLIANLLEVSRAARHTHSFEKTDLNFIINNVQQELAEEIKSCGAKILVSDLPELSAVGAQMQQIFTHIIANSLKFKKPETEPVVNISSKKLNTDEAVNLGLNAQATYYQIDISDNGIGFEQQYAENIFQIFTRLNGKKEFPGAGVGLAIVKKIIEKHKGLIFAESVPDEGSTFHIILPKNHS